MNKPNIYLDIDGVLLANESNAAPYAEEFLIYILDNYPGSVYWLTTHCWKGTNRTKEALQPAFSPKLIQRLDEIKPTDWNTSKTDAIDFSKPFLWFDDDLYPPEKTKLEEHQALSQWIEIDLIKDPHILKKIVTNLKAEGLVGPAEGAVPRTLNI